MSKLVIDATNKIFQSSSTLHLTSADDSYENCIPLLMEALNLKNSKSSIISTSVSSCHGHGENENIPLLPTQYSQLYYWDCGLACVQMILRWVTHHTHQNQSVTSRLELEIQQQRWMREFVNTQSIWTIDLYVLLHAIFDPSFPHSLNQKILLQEVFPSTNVKVSMVYFSDHCGVRESYGACEYYRDQLQEDTIRVRNLFDMAYRLGWNIFQTDRSSRSNAKALSLDIPTLIHFISRPDCVAIALVNQYLWSPSLSVDGDNAFSKSENQTYSSPQTVHNDVDDTKISNNINYTGHYILIVGITYDIRSSRNLKQHRFGWNSTDQYPYGLVVRDPGVHKNEDSTDIIVSVEMFESCWKSTGTDSDIILISRSLDFSIPHSTACVD